MKFPANGKWWANRRELSVEADGTVTVSLAVHPDWLGAVDLTGTPDTLRRVAQAIEAQVMGAEINTPPLESAPRFVGCDACDLPTHPDDIASQDMISGEGSFCSGCRSGAAIGSPAHAAARAAGLAEVTA